MPCARRVAGVNLQRLWAGKQCRKRIGPTACSLTATCRILFRPSGRNDPASALTMVIGEYHVIKVQDRLGEPLTRSCRGRQSLQCPVQIIGKEAGCTSLERSEIGAMLLRVFRKKSPEGSPWITFEGLSAATRLSLVDYEGAERVASKIRIAPKQLVSYCAIEKREMRPMRETLHRRDWLDPVQLPDMHWAASHRRLACWERRPDVCFPSQRGQFSGTSRLSNSIVRLIPYQFSAMR